MFYLHVSHTNQRYWCPIASPPYFTKIGCNHVSPKKLILQSWNKYKNPTQNSKGETHLNSIRILSWALIFISRLHFSPRKSIARLIFHYLTLFKFLVILWNSLFFCTNTGNYRFRFLQTNQFKSYPFLSMMTMLN